MQNEKDSVKSNQIDLKDIAYFFKSNSKLIATTAALMFLLSVAYVLLAPKKYEAIGYLQMALLQQAGGSAAAIESPAVAVERLRYPATYSEAAMEACGFADAESVGAYLGGMLKASAAKGMPNILEIRVRALTLELAKQCAESLVAMIEKQQYDLIEDRLQGRDEQLAGYQKALAVELRQLGTIKKPEAGNFGYLAKLDKLSLLRSRIDALQEEAMLAHQHPPKLIMPITVSKNPVSPKVKLVLLLGLLVGVLLGVLLALARTAWYKAKE